LNKLKGKKEWKWNEEHQKAFKELKGKIMSQLVLSLPRREGKFRVEMDTSGHTIGGVLSQEQDGKWKPIVFLLRMMQPVERNYEIYDKELLAIVEALTKWRQYLLDTLKTFEIWMVSQIRYSLVVILGLNSVSEVQYKDMMIDR